MDEYMDMEMAVVYLSVIDVEKDEEFYISILRYLFEQLSDEGKEKYIESLGNIGKEKYIKSLENIGKEKYIKSLEKTKN